MRGVRVTVIGLGRFGGGVGVTRWLCSQGAEVTVSDKASAEELAESVAALTGLDVTLHLGGHLEEDFLRTDLLIVNPAIPKDMPLLRKAIAAGVPRTTEINLFLQRCSARVVAVTGSVGKSTTTAMIGEILARRFTTHVGGNIGGSLLESLPRIGPDHVVVLEMSSFQLEDLPIIGVGPHVAVVTNLLPNHLDRHGTMEAYADAKKNIFRFQKPGDVLVLNAGSPIVSRWAAEAAGRVAYFAGDVSALRDRPEAAQWRRFDLKLPGGHNQANAQAAWTAARQLGVDRDAAAAAIEGFTGLPHRLEFVAEIDGVRYYNDSKCTTPEGAIVALNAFPPRSAVMIVGGYDKHVSFEDLGRALADRAKHVIALGQTRGAIVEAFRKAAGKYSPRVVLADTFEQAVAAARQRAGPGDVVLLSPACASYDMFRNYEQRGETFAKLVR
jgi:UDP-N-acetylmuramoylalanine--D-glutamate ligase